jgi:hypothetical protein
VSDMHVLCTSDVVELKDLFELHLSCVARLVSTIRQDELTSVMHRSA